MVKLLQALHIGLRSVIPCVVEFSVQVCDASCSFGMFCCKIEH